MSKVSLPALKLCSVCASKVATGWRGHCFDCAPSSDKSLKAYSDSVRPSAVCKSPVGVELELLGPGGSDADQCSSEWSLSRQTVAHLSRVVSSDGSIRNGAGGEIKVCSGSASIARVAADVVQRARLSGCVPDKSCGLHVHLSLGKLWEGYQSRLNRSSASIADQIRFQTAREFLGRFLHDLESPFFEGMPRSRRASDYVKRFRYGCDFGNDLRSHYSWASLSSKFPTLEIRLHGSTVNPWKVVGWLDLMRGLHSRVSSLVDAVLTTPADNVESFGWGLSWSDEEKSKGKYSEFVKSLGWSESLRGSVVSLVDAGSPGARYWLARNAAGGSLSDFRL